MVPMVLVVLVLIVLVAAGIVAAVLHRPSGDDIHSVQSYNNALGTLEHLSERIGPPTRPAVRPVVLPRTDASDEPVRLPVPPVRVRGTDEFPDPDEPIVFDDARPADRRPPTPAAADEPTPAPRTGRQQRIALGSMDHRKGPGPVPIAIGAAVVLFVVLAIIGSHHGGRSSASSSTPTTAGGTATTRPPTTTRPTPTTLPTKLTPTTSSTDGTSATYAVPRSSYQLTVTGTGSCWVQVTSASSGSTVWAGALSTGTIQNINASGTVTVQFGTPTLTLAVDDIPLVLPTPLRTPFVATIQPAAAAGGTTTTTTTAGTASDGTSAGAASGSTSGGTSGGSGTTATTSPTATTTTAGA